MTALAIVVGLALGGTAANASAVSGLSAVAADQPSARPQSRGLNLDIAPFLRQLTASETERPARPSRRADLPPLHPTASHRAGNRPAASSARKPRKSATARLRDGVSVTLDRPADQPTTTLSINADDMFTPAGAGADAPVRLSLSSDSQLRFSNADSTPAQTTAVGPGAGILSGLHMNGGAELALGRPGAGASIAVNGAVDRDLSDTAGTDRSGSVKLAADLGRTGDLFSISGNDLQLGSSTVNMDASFDLKFDAALDSTVSQSSADTQWQLTSAGETSVSAGSRINLSLRPAATGPADGATPPYDDLTLVADIRARISSGLSAAARSLNQDVPGLLIGHVVTDNGSARLNTAPDMDAVLDRLAPGLRGTVAGGGVRHHAAGLDVDIKLADWQFQGGPLAGLMFGEGDRDVNLWARGFSKRIDQRDASAAGYTSDVAGGAVGGDIELNPDFRLGAAASYTMLDAGGSNSGHDLGFDTYLMSTYGRYRHAAWSFESNFTLASNQYRNDRRDASSGALAEGGRFSGQQLSSSVTWSRAFVASRGGRLVPSANLGFTHLDLAEYDAAEPVTARNYRFMRAQVGAKYRWRQHARGMHYTPEVRATLSHDFGDIEPIDTASFAAGSPSIVKRSSSAARNALKLGASLGIVSRDGLDVRAKLDFAYREDQSEQTGEIVARLDF